MRDAVRQKLLAGRCLIDCHTHVGVSYPSYLGLGYPYCLSFEDLVVRMDHLGIDCSMVTPFVNSCYFKIKPGDPGEVEPTEEFCRFPYEAENINLFREVYKIFPEYSDRALPFAMFDPSRKTEEQAELLETLWNEFGFFGLKTVPTYIQAFVTDMDTKAAPIVDFAQRHDLPITFHSAYDKGDPWSQLQDILNFAELHPELRICVAHAARLHRESLERADALDNCFVDLSAFDIHCLLIRKNHRAMPPADERFPANYEDSAAALKDLVNAFGDTLIWGSDTPYNYYMQRYRDGNGEIVDISLPSRFDTETRILRALPDEDIARISYSNSLRLLFGKEDEQ